MTTVPGELVKKLHNRFRKDLWHADTVDAARIAAEYYEPKIAELKQRLERESSGVHGYEISGNTIYIGPMRPDRVKVAEITCTIDWDETYTEEAKTRRIRDAERICRGLDRE